MKLEGSLDTFALPEVFALLALTRKTGALHVRCGAAAGVVWFRDGGIAAATADASRRSLLRRLAAGVPEGALRAALDGPEPPVPALQAAGVLDPDAVRAAAAEHATDAVFELLSWPDGTFAFAPDEAPPDPTDVNLAADAVVGQAVERRAVWNDVVSVVPSPLSVPALPLNVAGTATVSREEWSVLALVDGRRSVAELVDLTGAGRYAVATTLAALVRRGLLVVREDAAEDPVRSAQRRQELVAQLEAAGGPGVARERAPDRGPEPSSAAAEPAEAPPGPAHGPAEPPYGPAEPLSGPAEPAYGPVPDAVEELPRRTVPAEPAALVRMSRADAMAVVGTAAVAPDPPELPGLESDPSINRSLLLRLIAGVQGL